MAYTVSRVITLLSKDLEEPKKSGHGLADARNTEKYELDTSIENAITDAGVNTPMRNSLACIVADKKKKASALEKVKLWVVKTIVKIDDAAAVEAEQSSESPILKSISRLLKSFTTRVFKAIVRPVIRLATRVCVNLIRFTLRALISEVVIPILTGVLGFIAANPLFLLAGVAIGGVGYWLWDKYFRSAEGGTLEQASRYVEYAKEVGPEPISEAITTVQKAISTEGTAAAVRARTPETIAREKAGKVKPSKFKGFGASIDSYIREASTKYKVPEDVLRGFIKMEGGWSGQMSPTGAIGAGQFIYDTWNELAATSDGKSIGMIPITSSTFRTSQDPRFDQHVNILATALLAKKNTALLQKNGLPVTGENLYMLHNIGPGIISVMLGKRASAETIKAMVNNGMVSSQSASDFLAWQKKRYAAQYTIANAKQELTTVAANNTSAGLPVTVPAKSVGMNTTAPAISDSSTTNVMTAPSMPDRYIGNGPGNTLVARSS